MRSSLFAVTLLSLSIVSAGPIHYKRQDEGTTALDGGDGASTTAVGGGDGGSSTTVNPENPTSPPPSTPSPAPPTGPSPDEGEQCRPCTSEGYRTYTIVPPAGSTKTCYCLGGSTDPWEWSDKRCINDGVGLPNDEGRPYFCLGSGSNPSSRACLSQCNFMLNTVNSVNPCNQNLYNAARTCAGCVPGGAIHYQLDGKSPSGPYIQGIDSMNTFMDGMKNWCVRPSRCIDLSTGGKISGTGGCPVINNAESSSSSASDGGSGGAPASRQTGGNLGADPDAIPSPTVRGNGGNTSKPSAKIVTTSTISTTDADGRPTFSLQLATIDNPEFTANTGFADARPTTSSEEGRAITSIMVTKPAVIATVIAVIVFVLV